MARWIASLGLAGAAVAKREEARKTARVEWIEMRNGNLPVLRRAVKSGSMARKLSLRPLAGKDADRMPTGLDPRQFGVAP